jgi:GNAT superfamily N-acetyltransferase
MAPDDVTAATALHLVAMPEFFLTQLGPRFLATYYRRLLRDNTAIAKVVRAAGGELMGVVVGSINPAGFYGRLLRGAWWAFGWAAIPAVVRSPVVVSRLLRAVRFPSDQPVGESIAGLYSITVDPAHQGRGVGRSLVAAFLRSAEEGGCDSVYLHADAVGNDGWNSLLRRMGWQLRREFVTPEGRRMNEYWYEFERSI